MDDAAHAFDFWIGDWEVFTAHGELLGHNTISPVLGTGALAEHWRGAKSIEGRSLTAWDVGRGCWHQTWIDSGGGVLLLDGDIVDGSMVLEGVHEGVRQRITWTPTDGEVRQLWETSADGQIWETAFDGRYRRTAGG